MTIHSANDYFRAVEAMGRHEYERYAQYRVTVPCGRAGPWRVRHVTTQCDVGYLRFLRDGRAPGLGKFTHLTHDTRGTVMSDTVPEVIDFLRYTSYLKGHVLITGLGIGMAVHILKNTDRGKGVKSITVVEKDAYVVKLSGPHYAKLPRVKIINADAWEWLPPEGKLFDAAWHDIWDEGHQGAEWRRIKARFRKFVRDSNQHCWGKGM